MLVRRLATFNFNAHHTSRICSFNNLARSFSNQALLRNIGIIAHVDAGKTTTTERMLRLSGAVSREGRVDNGDTITDYLIQERERGITIQSAAVYFNWRSNTICLIDTPGHVDFTIEVERSLRVLDGVVILIDAVAGVQAQTETVWKQANNYDLPAIAFINKMDREGAGFDAACKSLKSRLGVECLPLQMPLIVDECNVGCIDLITMDVHKWPISTKSTENINSSSNETEISPLIEYGSINSQLINSVYKARKLLLEQLSDLDDEFCMEMLELMEDDVEEDVEVQDIESLKNSLKFSPSISTIIATIKKVCNLSSSQSIKQKGEGDADINAPPRVVPVLMGASLRGIGVEALLDASVALLPNPSERSAPLLISPHQSSSSSSSNKKKNKNSDDMKTLHVSQNDPFCALAFKVTNDTHRGALVYLRVYSGLLKKGQVLQCGGGVGCLNGDEKGFKERMTHLLKPFGDDLVPVDEAVGAGPGDTVVAVGLKKTVTGDSLVAFKGPLHGYTLPRIPIPHPVFALSVYPVSSLKAKALEEALLIMSRDDPSLVVGPDPENTDEILMQGMGELHLDVACSRLKTEFGIDVKTGRMRIAYRESMGNLPISINQFKFDRLIGEIDKQKRLFIGYSIKLSPISESLGIQQEQDGKYLMNSLAIVSISNEVRKEIGNLEKSEMIKKAFEKALLIGPRYGFPLIGFHLQVLSVETDSDTNPNAIIQGAEALIKHLLKLNSSSVELLQPMMALEVNILEENMGNVLTDLTVGRNATIKSVDVVGSGVNIRHIIKSDAPLSKLLGFSTDLRSLTSGEGLFSMEYSHHCVIDQLPDEDAGLSN